MPVELSLNEDVLQLTASLLASIIAFFAAMLATVAVQVGIHSNEAFEHDAGADFALGMLMLAVALVVAIVVFVLVFNYLRLRSKRAASPGREPLAR